MLVTQDYLLYNILKSGTVKNTVLLKNESAAGYIDLDHTFRIELSKFTNAIGIDMHQIILGDQFIFPVSSNLDLQKATNQIKASLNGKCDEGLIFEIIQSIKAVLKDLLLEMQQEEFIKKLMIDCAS